MRRYSWILPSFGLAVAVHAHFCGMHSYVNMAIVQMVLMSCLTLGVPEALRRASAKSTSQTKVAGLTLSALMFAAVIGLVMLLLSVFATARGRSRVTVFRRTIPAKQVSDAVSVVAMAFLLAFGSAVCLSVTNGLDFSDCLYETV